MTADLRAEITPAFLFVIGASGTGKTTAVRSLAARSLPGVGCYYFDSIGVPTPEIMERDFGGGEGWQATMTARWVECLAENGDHVEVAVLDGQTRPSFIRPALRRLQVPRARTVLLDCRRFGRRVCGASAGNPTSRPRTWMSGRPTFEGRRMRSTCRSSIRPA